MDRYAVVNLAGSAGKSTSVATYALLLAQQGLRVRVIDLDAQANASSWLGHPNYIGPTIADVLREQKTLAQVEVEARVFAGYDEHDQPMYDPIDNVTLIPANRHTLDQLMIELAVVRGEGRLHEAIVDDETSDDIDILLIDCPGTLNVLVLAGILGTSEEEDGYDPRNSWGVITVTKPSGKENEGIPDLQRQLAGMKRLYRVEIPLLAILPCQVPSQTGTYKEQMENLVEAYGDIVAPTIRRATVVDTAYTQRCPLPLFGYRAKPIMTDYRKQLANLQSRKIMIGRRGRTELTEASSAPAH